MDKKDDSRRYKWSDSAVNLLVSIWSHDQVQNQLGSLTRNQPIWESIARFMSRRGYSVTGLQCKTRIKNMLCLYNEATRKGDTSLLEPYFDTFRKVDKARKVNRKDKKINVQKIKLETSSESDEHEDDSQNLNLLTSETGMKNSQVEDYSIEYLEPNIGDSTSSNQGMNTMIIHLEQVITSAINTQTKLITEAIEIQTKTIETLINAENERLATIMAAERENRRQLETRLDTLISRLEENKNYPKDMTYILEPNRQEESALTTLTVHQS